MFSGVNHAVVSHIYYISVGRQFCYFSGRPESKTYVCTCRERDKGGPEAVNAILPVARWPPLFFLSVTLPVGHTDKIGCLMATGMVNTSQANLQLGSQQ